MRSRPERHPLSCTGEQSLPMGDVDINRGIDRVHDSQADMETVCDDRRCSTLSMNEIARKHRQRPVMSAVATLLPSHAQ
jgi:hypothetical protein